MLVDGRGCAGDKGLGDELVGNRKGEGFVGDEEKGGGSWAVELRGGGVKLLS